MIFPMLPFYAQTFHATPWQIGFLAAGHSLANFISAPIFGRISDRIGRKPLLFAGAIGASGAMITMGLSNNLWALLLGRFLSGFSASAIMPTARAYMADMTIKEERVAGMGKVGAAMASGQLFGPAFSSFLVGFGGIHVPFFVAAVISLINALSIILILPESLKEKAEKLIIKEGFLNFIAIFNSLRTELGILFLVMFAWALSMSNNQVAFPLLLEEKFNLGAQHIGFFFTATAIISILMQAYFLPRIVKIFGEKKTLLTGMVVMGSAMFLIPLSNSLLGLTVAFIIMGLGSTLNRPVAEGIVSRLTETGQGTTMGLSQSFESLGRIIGPTSAGIMFTFFSSAPFFVSGLLLFSLAFAALFFLKISKANSY